MSRAGTAADEVRLSSDSIEVVVLPGVGARLHRLKAFGHDVLRTPGDPAEHRRNTFSWGAYHMAPWCNRLEARPVTVGGRLVDLAPNFRDGTAIHGQVYALPWTQVSETAFVVRGGGTGGWPWSYEVALRVLVAGASLALEHSLTNGSGEHMPAGIGVHPWFRRPVEVAIRADRVYPSNVDTPVVPEPVGGRFDLRRLGEMPLGLDATWTDVADPAVEFRWPRLGLRATLSVVTAAEVHIVAASPRDSDATAVEPQTHAPYGLRRLLEGELGALAALAPGATLALRTELSFHPEPVAESREDRA